MKSTKDLYDGYERHVLRLAAQSQSYSKSRLGTLGPASPVRRIDPKTGEVMADQAANLPAEDFKARGRFRRRRY